jgi:hypothetical protein
MIWDGISHVERTDLKVIDGNLNAARYRDEIIVPIVLPFLVVGQLCDVVLALNLSKDVVHEGHTDAICSALSVQKFGHWFY